MLFDKRFEKEMYPYYLGGDKAKCSLVVSGRLGSLTLSNDDIHNIRKMISCISGLKRILYIEHSSEINDKYYGVVFTANNSVYRIITKNFKQKVGDVEKLDKSVLDAFVSKDNISWY